MKLEIKDVSFSYKNDDNLQLNNINITINNGTCLGIMGESGSGKTTLLKLLISSLDYKGEVFYNGLDLNLVPINKRGFSYVSQTFTMYPTYNVYNNIALPLKRLKIDSDEIDDRVIEIARLFKIEHLLTRKVKQLSLGQAQIVSLARSMVRISDLYIMDEPFANIDKETRIYIRNVLKEYKTKYNATFIIASHDVNDLISLSDNCVILEEGSIIMEGPILDIINNPKSEYVKKILSQNAGDINE